MLNEISKKQIVNGSNWILFNFLCLQFLFPDCLTIVFPLVFRLYFVTQRKCWSRLVVKFSELRYVGLTWQTYLDQTPTFEWRADLRTLTKKTCV